MTAMPGMPGLGPWLYHATSVKFVGIPVVPLPFHESPTLWTLASTPIALMISRAGAAGCAKEVPLPCGVVDTKAGSSTNACASNPRVWINTERPATSRPTPMDRRTAFFMCLFAVSAAGFRQARGDRRYRRDIHTRQHIYRAGPASPAEFG